MVPLCTFPEVRSHREPGTERGKFSGLHIKKLCPLKEVKQELKSAHVGSSHHSGVAIRRLDRYHKMIGPRVNCLPINDRLEVRASLSWNGDKKLVVEDK